MKCFKLGNWSGSYVMSAHKSSSGVVDWGLVSEICVLVFEVLKL